MTPKERVEYANGSIGALVWIKDRITDMHYSPLAQSVDDIAELIRAIDKDISARENDIVVSQTGEDDE